MAMQTVIGLFDEFARAHGAVDGLLLRKYDRADISVVANEAARAHPGESGVGPGSGAVKQDDAAIEDTRTAGTATGMLGLVAGFGALTLPAVGPILAGGPILGMLAGLAAGEAAGDGPGGLVAALQQVGAPRPDAELYAEAVRRGGTLVIVRTEEHLAGSIAALLADMGAVDVERRRRSYQEGGFAGFDPKAEPYTAEAIDRERARLRGRAGDSSYMSRKT